jgi:DNA-binding NarL/FixJ family response regulator
MVVRILIADDHKGVRICLRRLLSSHPGWDVCGEAIDGREAIRQAQRLSPDVVLLDIAMPNVNGLEAAHRIHQVCPHAELLILSQHDPQLALPEALKTGARGCISKASVARELFEAIEAVTR